MGTIWFYGDDICGLLRYTNAPKAIKDHCRKRQVDITKRYRNGTTRNVTIINESGLYRLLMKSEMPEADKFQDWITDTVIPSIRKTGGYQIREFARLKLIEMAIERMS